MRCNRRQEPPERRPGGLLPGKGMFAAVRVILLETLFAAGFVAGSGGGRFCPNDPITRGRKSVFLASSLGLSFSQ